MQVLTHLDGTTSALYGDKVYALKAVPKAEKAVKQPAQGAVEPPKPRSQPADHPWKRQQPSPPKGY